MYQYEYNSRGLVTKETDAVGRETLYEYATISRNYGAGILLTFVFCALFAAQKRKKGSAPLGIRLR